MINVPHLLDRREQDVYKALYTIDTSKATGSDGIPARISKIAALHISLQVVTHLFNESFNQGIYPPSRKTAVLRMKTTIGLSQSCPASRKSKSLSWIVATNLCLRSRSNSTAPVCLRQKLFYYNCIHQNSRFMEICYRQRGKGYMCFSWPSKIIWRNRSRYSFGQDASVRCTRNSSGVDEELSIW